MACRSLNYWKKKWETGGAGAYQELGVMAYCISVWGEKWFEYGECHLE